MKFIKHFFENMDILTLTKISKFAMILTSGAAGAAGISVVNEVTGWYFDNQTFMWFVFLTIAIDHILGSWNHLLKLRDWSWKKNRNGLFQKTAGSIFGYVLFEMIYQIMEDYEFAANYFKLVIQLTVIMYPMASALKNVSIFTNGKLPPKIWLDKIENFNKRLDINIFKTELNESEKSNSNPASDNNSNELSEQKETSS